MKSRHAQFSPRSQAYRLQVRLFSPCVYYSPVVLDSLVAYCLNKESASRPFYTGPGWNNHGIWQTLRETIWQDSDCSVCTEFLPASEPVRFLESIKKRFEQRYQHLVDFGKGRKRKINTSAAPYRGYNKPMPAVAVGAGSWHFIGDGPRVLELVGKWAVGVGKDVNAGFGWIDSAECTESDWTREKILAHRPTPVQLARRYGITGRTELRAWRPPYWSSKNIAPCIVGA